MICSFVAIWPHDSYEKILFLYSGSLSIVKCPRIAHSGAVNLKAKIPMKHSYSLAALALASISLIALRPERAYSQSVTAVASGSWFSDWDAPPAAAGVAAPGATATAGSNLRRVGGTTVTDPQTSGTYAKGGASEPFLTLSGTISSATTSSFAFPVKYNAATNTFNYRVSAFASVLVTPVSSSAQASATANDPQFVATPGIFGETLGLNQGSQLFSDSSVTSSASMHFEYDGIGILSSPIASIDISSSEGGPAQATVFFNSDPRLQFFAPGTTTPITASDVASLLDSSSVQSQLASSGGLASDLELFDFNIDLTGTSLSPDAAFGAMTLGQAEGAGAPIPEPSAYAAAMGLLALGAAGLRRSRRIA